MDTPYKDIGARLEAVAMARDLTGAEITRRSNGKILQSRWTEYTQGSRRITVDAAVLIYQMTGATLDYIYRGDESGLPKSLVERLHGRAA